MDNNIKELLAKARKKKKDIEDGSIPFEDIVLEEKVCFGMYDHRSLRSTIDDISRRKNKEKKKDNKK